jgi:hypothetical protein
MIVRVSSAVGICSSGRPGRGGRASFATFDPILCVGSRPGTRQPRIRWHYEEGDVYGLARLVPDADERERIIEIARRLIRRRQFKVVRDALRAKFQFRDVLHDDEIARVAHRLPILRAPPLSGRAAAPEAAAVAGLRDSVCGQGGARRRQARAHPRPE